MVWGFGDSFTQGCFEGDFIKYPYVNIISHYLNQECTNKARYGMAFEDINATITKHLQYIRKGDTVIVGGTIVDRIMFPVPYEQISDFHGTEPVGDKSLTGINYLTLDYFFDDWAIGTDKMKEMGYEHSKEEYTRLIFDYNHLLKEPFYQAFTRFYEDWLKHWESYFASIGVSFYWWHYSWWRTAPKENIGKCGHWDQAYHEEFAKLLFTFMENNSSGCFESSTVI